jgi:hypothetical protein
MQGKHLINSMAQPSKSNDPQNKRYPRAQTPTSHRIPRSSSQRKKGRAGRPVNIVMARLLTSKRSILKLRAPRTRQTDLVVMTPLSERGCILRRGPEFLLPEIALDLRLKKISIQGSPGGNDRIEHTATKHFSLSHGLQRMVGNQTRTGLERTSVGHEGRRLQ